MTATDVRRHIITAALLPALVQCYGCADTTAAANAADEVMRRFERSRQTGLSWRAAQPDNDDSDYDGGEAA